MVAARSRIQLSVPQVHRSTFGTRAFSVARLTVWNSLPDYLWDPAFDSEQFRHILKTDIKLPVPIVDAKTMLSFSTLHELHHKKLLHQWLNFSGPHSKIS